MRFGRALMAGLGWAGTLGGLALCVLILVSAAVTFDGDGPGVKSRKDGVVRLLAVPEADVPRVALATPPARLEGATQAWEPGRTRAPAADTLPDAVDALIPRR